MTRFRRLRPVVPTLLQAVNRAFVSLCVAVTFLVLFRYFWLDSHDRYKCSALLTRGSWLESSIPRWQPPGCMMHEYTGKEISNCLKSRKIVFIGDSTTRQIFWATARKLDAGAANEAQGRAEKHSDLRFGRSGVTVEFFWDPFLNSSTLHQYMEPFQYTLGAPANATGPINESAAVLMIGGGLWHARHLGNSSFKHFYNSVESILPFMDSGELRTSYSRLPPMFERPFSRNLVMIAPVQEPWYASLSTNRAATMTPAKVDPLNGYLHNASMNLGAPITWSYHFMTENRSPAYEENGIHVTNNVARQKADVLLNTKCNTELTRVTGYPMDKTCCSGYIQANWIQKGVILSSLVILPLLVMITSGDSKRLPWLPSAKILRALSVLALVLCYCFFADRTQIFNKIHKQFTLRTFVALCLITLVLGLLSIRRSAASSIPKFPCPSTRKLADQPFLSRDQTDEWKGWMQFLILIYHYTGASNVLWIYEIIRILVASYLFMTGFGHTIFFYKKGDYSLRRCASVLIRLNLLSCFLPYAMRTDYLFYYFAPLISFWYIMIFLTMKIGHRKSSSLCFLLSKIIISAITVTASVRSPFVFEGIFYFLRLTSNVHWNVTEWRFRLQLDIYIVYFGMIAGILFVRLSDVPCGQHSENRIFALVRNRFFQIKTFSIAIALGTFPVFWILIRSFPDKYAYNRYFPYVSFLPILAFIILRNSTYHLRNFHSSIFAWLGRHSLETFTLQFHIWMAADTKGLLSLGIFGRNAASIDGRWQDFALITAIFFWVSWHVASATGTITSWIIDPTERKSEVESEESRSCPTSQELPRMKHRHDLKASDQGTEAERYIIRRGAYSVSRFVREDLRIRLVILVVVMWILNLTYS